jgi:hypothetical protein
MVVVSMEQVRAGDWVIDAHILQDRSRRAQLIDVPSAADLIRLVAEAAARSHGKNEDGSYSIRRSAALLPVRGDEGRIDALFTLYFLALLVQAIIERELRLAMKHDKIAELPLYPEQRSCTRPTTEQVLRLFSLAERHQLLQDGKIVQVFDVQLTDLQHLVLKLLGVLQDAFRFSSSWRRFRSSHPTSRRGASPRC